MNSILAIAHKAGWKLPISTVLIHLNLPLLIPVRLLLPIPLLHCQLLLLPLLHHRPRHRLTAKTAHTSTATLSPPTGKHSCFGHSLKIIKITKLLANRIPHVLFPRLRYRLLRVLTIAWPTQINFQFGCQFSIIRTNRPMVSTASITVSKTVGPGSNHGGPAKSLLNRAAKRHYSLRSKHPDAPN